MTPTAHIPDHSASTTVTAPPGVRSATSRTRAVTVPPEMLDGGETVILAVKPSFWFVFFEPIRWIAVLLLLLVWLPWLSDRANWGVSQQALTQGILLVLVVRVLASVLRWVSRFYVLTNRRVMWVRGVLRADCWGCPLLRIHDTRLSAGPHEKAAKLASLEFVTDDLPVDDRSWRYIARPEEIHAEVRRAIARAHGGGPGP